MLATKSCHRPRELPLDRYGDFYCRDREGRKPKSAGRTVGGLMVESAKQFVELKAELESLRQCMTTLVQLVDRKEVQAWIHLRNHTPPTSALLKLAADPGIPEGLDEPQDSPWLE